MAWCNVRWIKKWLCQSHQTIDPIMAQDLVIIPASPRFADVLHLYLPWENERWEEAHGAYTNDTFNRIMWPIDPIVAEDHVGGDHSNQSQAPVPLSIFRSNSKFDENSEPSSFKYIRPITTIFCTRHDSDTVVTCAKYRCDRPRIFYTRVFWIFIEFRIRSKYA